MTLRLHGRLGVLLVLVFAGPISIASHGQPRRADPPWQTAQIASTTHLNLNGGVLQVDVAGGSLDLPVDTVIQHVRAAPFAVPTYYGRFPVPHARLLLIRVADKSSRRAWETGKRP